MVVSLQNRNECAHTRYEFIFFFAVSSKHFKRILKGVKKVRSLLQNFPLICSFLWYNIAIETLSYVELLHNLYFLGMLYSKFLRIALCFSKIVENLLNDFPLQFSVQFGTSQQFL